MSCKRFCSARKSQLIEDSQQLPLGLKIFLKAHHLLKNFIDFFKFVRQSRRVDDNSVENARGGLNESAINSWCNCILKNQVPHGEMLQHELR